MYSYLAQDELGFSVFGHRDQQKNIKRKYVFDITYGFYDLDVAQLQERLRGVHSRLRELQARQDLFETFFEDTALENRAGIEHELREVNAQLQMVETASKNLASVHQEVTGTAELQFRILKLQSTIGELKAGIDSEHKSLNNLRELTHQLESQSSKLTRSIVSNKHLTDLEFLICPRCGAELKSGRAEEGSCHLCLQEPHFEFSRETLIGEQGAVEQQLTEIQDLIRERESRSTNLQEQLSRAQSDLSKKQIELEFQSKSYVSEQATQIASLAAQRARLTSRLQQLQEYLDVLSKMDDSQKIAARLAVEKNGLEQDLLLATAKSNEGYRRVGNLKRRFNEILEKLRPPKFGEQELSGIDPKTYLPDFFGRAFGELSSPGLATLVNLAHALAHHLTAIELDLRLPQILIIDGLSEHLGEEGLDPARLAAAYDILIETSNRHPELQVILVDNEIPDTARAYVRLELSEEDRLIRDTHTV